MGNHHTWIISLYVCKHALIKGYNFKKHTLFIRHVSNASKTNWISPNFNLHYCMHMI